MKPLIAISFIPLLLMVFLACRNTDARLSSRDVSAITPEYERAIQDLAEGKDPQTVITAIRVLSDAKTQAFPALIKHLSDKTPASFEFFGLRDILCAQQTTPCPPWQPTIGEACFQIIQSEVEGNWPKAYRSHYTLTAGNVGEWWESRRTMSLKDLQLDAAKTSLERARGEKDTSRIWSSRGENETAKPPRPIQNNACPVINRPVIRINLLISFAEDDSVNEALNSSITFMGYVATQI